MRQHVTIRANSSSLDNCSCAIRLYENTWLPLDKYIWSSKYIHSLSTLSTLAIYFGIFSLLVAKFGIGEISTISPLSLHCLARHDGWISKFIINTIYGLRIYSYIDIIILNLDSFFHLSFITYRCLQIFFIQWFFVLNMLNLSSSSSSSFFVFVFVLFCFFVV